jgi:hypothetical protein
VRTLERYGLLVVAVVGAALAHPLCNLTFRCGCSLLHLTRDCNIHHAAPPHCPWCARPPLFALALAAGALAALLAVRLSRRLVGRRAAVTIGGGLLALVAAMVAVGKLTALASGYPP